MGCGKYLTCRTCKEDYYLGYGSYSSWITLEEIRNNTVKNRPDLIKGLLKIVI